MWSLLFTRQRWWSHQLSHHRQKPRAACKLHGSVLYRAGVIANQSFTLREKGFFLPFCCCDLDLDKINFIYEHGLYSLEIYHMCENELLTSRLSKVIVLQTYRQRDRPKLYITPLRGWSNTQITWSPITLTRAYTPSQLILDYHNVKCCVSTYLEDTRSKL